MHTVNVDNNLITDPIAIVNEQQKFYAKLYTENPNVRFTYENTTNIKLSRDEAERVGRPITWDEMFDAMMMLKRGKTPGCDGLPIEFYHSLWDVLSEPLFNLLTMCIDTGELNMSARRGVISLIPKKAPDLMLIKNWRPITLLNYDYKILAKMIANRLEETVHLIGDQQTGFLKGRSIHNNIRKTIEVVTYLKKANLPGIVAEVDFSKCFDRVSFEALRNTFRYFGFPESYINLQFLLFTHFEFCTVNNGYVSQFERKGRGVNQGYPASPVCYSYAKEIMSHMIGNNNDVRGVPIEYLKDILSQFADDSAAFLNYDKTTNTAFCNTLARIEANLGLQVSYDKTTLYRLGSLCNSDAKIYTECNLKWSSKPIETLGVLVNCDGSLNAENYTKIMDKVKSVCQSWSNRQLTLTGKVLLVNVLLGSMFVYKMICLQNMPEYLCAELERHIQQFLWNGKRAKISLDTLKCDHGKGGLRLVHIRQKQNALKILSIFQSECDPFLHKCMHQSLVPELGSITWLCNIREKDVLTLELDDTVWKEALIAWSKINYHSPCDASAVRRQVLWLNSHIKINNKCILWKKWIKCGIYRFEHLLQDENKLCTWEEFKERFPELKECDWFKYTQITNAIPQNWLALLMQGNGKVW